MHMFCFSGCGLWFKTSDSQVRLMSAISRSYNGPKYCCIRNPISKMTPHVMASSAACPRRRNHRFIEHLQNTLRATRQTDWLVAGLCSLPIAKPRSAKVAPQEGKEPKTSWRTPDRLTRNIERGGRL